MRQKYPHSTFFFRCLNFIFRNLLKDQAFYYSGILLKKDLSCDLPLLETNGYKFMQADVNDIRSICEHPESPDFEVYKDRLLRNHVCYCAKDNNEVMCYVWLCFDTCGLFFGTDKEVQFLPLASNQVYSYNLYTFNNHRHKGIASQLHNYCNISLKSKGITERLVIIGPSFIGSMKISLRNGFHATANDIRL